MVFEFAEKKSLQAIDWIIIAVYFVACIIVGLLVSTVFIVCIENKLKTAVFPICKYKFGFQSSFIATAGCR